MYKLRMPKCLPVQTSPWKLDSPNYLKINTSKMKLLTQAPLQASSSRQTFLSHEARALVYQASHTTRGGVRASSVSHAAPSASVHPVSNTFEGSAEAVTTTHCYSHDKDDCCYYSSLCCHHPLPEPMKWSYPGSSLPLLPRPQCHGLFSTQSQSRSFKYKAGHSTMLLKPYKSFLYSLE